MVQMLSSCDVQPGPCLVAMCGRLLSRCDMGLPSNYSEGPCFISAVSSSLVVLCRLLSSCGRGTTF